MNDQGEIDDRRHFQERLEAALETLAILNDASPDFELLQVLEAQLQFMHECVADGGSPRRADQDRITLGALAVRNLDESAPELSSELSRLDYAFRHWDSLKSST